MLEKEAIDDLSAVQTVLNSMSSRFKVDMEPIKSPIAYFRSLLKSLQYGDFDSSYAEIYKEQSKTQQQQESSQTEQQQHREYLHKYNDAKNCYEKLKLYLHSSDKSMRQLAKDLGWLALLEEMGFDVNVEVKHPS